jgi:hypothetical protein
MRERIARKGGCTIKILKGLMGGFSGVAGGDDTSQQPRFRASAALLSS